MSDKTRGESFVMQGEVEKGQVDFTAFLFGLASTVMIHLGSTPHPETGKVKRDLSLARETLDLLGMLREKTRGNLNVDEERVFEKLLADLRLQFVEANKR
jgi:hypothetical protein